MLDAKVAALNFGFIGYQPPQRSINPSSLVAQGFVVASRELRAPRLPPVEMAELGTSDRGLDVGEVGLHPRLLDVVAP